MGLSWSSQDDHSTARVYDWHRDTPDTRDYYHAFSVHNSRETLPDRIDLRDQCPAVYDSDTYGTSTVRAVAAMYHMHHSSAGERPRLDESVTSIRDSLKSIASLDVPPHHGIYRRVPHTVTTLKTCLSERLPFVFGFLVSKSFESRELAETGIMTLPKSEEAILGGHAVICVGYSDRRRSFLIRNSWGDEWGEGGYFWMPYRLMRDQKRCSDFWTMTKGSEEEQPIP